MSDVIGKGVIEVSADASKLKGGMDEAKRSIKGLGAATNDMSAKASASIDRYVQRLKTQSAVLGKSTREAELYKLALRGASKDQLAAADSALKMAEGFERGAAIGNRLKGSLLALGAAGVTGFIAAAAALDGLVKKAGEFQDIAEKTGDTAENIASLAVAAGTAGKSMDEVSSFAIKLTKNLTGVDDDSKKAGAAITALGLDINKLKTLQAADQLEAIGKALNGFTDSNKKPALLEAIAKGGAELLPFLKELGQEGGRQVILTEQQIRLADEYSDKQAKLRTQIGLYAQAIATEMLPAYIALQESILDTAKEVVNLGSNTDGLRGNTSIKDFAESGAVAIAGLIDGLYNAGKALIALKGSLNVIAADITVVGKIASFATPQGLISATITGQNRDIKKALDEREKTLVDANKRYEALSSGLGLADKVKGRFATQAFADPRILGNPGSIADQTRKTLNFDGAEKKGKNTGAQEAKAQLALDIEEIRKGSDALVNTFTNAEKIMEARRAAGLIDERDYYASKLGFLNLNTRAQEDALQKELARLQAEKVAGKDKIENDKKIIDVQAKLTKVRESSVASIEVLSLQEQAASRKLAQYYRDAEDAAQSYLDTIRRTNEREISGFGKGTQERDRTAGRAQIEDKYEQQRRDLEKSKRDAELTGAFGPEAQQKYDDELDRIRRFQATALAEYDVYYKRRLDMEGNWANGATEALLNYQSEAANIAKQTEDLFANAFKGMEDALVGFVTTGKLDFKSLAQSIIADIARIIIKQQISNALGVAGNKGGSGGSGGFGGFIAGLFGSGGGGESMIGNMGAESIIPGFDGGGFTGVGARTGGVDGKGGFPAILHPNETVIDHTRGQSASGSVSVQVNVDASGSKVQGENDKSDQLGKRIGAVIRQVLVEEKMPGGILA